MKCNKCGFDNQEDSVFCSKCGTRLATTCPNCGKPISADSYFCSYCGENLSMNSAEHFQSKTPIKKQQYFDIQEQNDKTEDKSLYADFSPEWFREKAKEFWKEDREAESLYVDFRNRFGIEALSSLSGEALLKTLFIGASSDNLCHELEFAPRNTHLFGGIKGGSIYKYPMYFDKKTSMWTLSKGKRKLSLEEAIEKGTTIRDDLVRGAEIINESSSVDSVEDYLALYPKLCSIIPELVDRLWVTKYYHMLFPTLIPVFYNKDWQIRVLTLLKIAPNDYAYGRLGQINAFVKKCGVTNVAFAQVIYNYCSNGSIEEFDDSELERISGGSNIIFYGVPGSGKSWTIEHEYCHPDSIVERVVFHPDYTNADFIGQILPVVDADRQVSYEFTPGPFTSIVRESYRNPTSEYILIVEEMNRGNAASIFGDTFQLLDRSTEPKTENGITYPIGTSEYGITNKNMADYIYDDPSHKVRIPSNLSIIGTMNTSDQNVFTLDTAFQRRWKMRLIENSFKKTPKSLADAVILDTKVTWKTFCEIINGIIIGNKAKMASAEDKRLGVYFIQEEDLTFKETEPSEGYDSLSDEYESLSVKQVEGATTAEEDKRLASIIEIRMHNSAFAEKVLKYLWDDAFKFNLEALFDTEQYQSLEQVILTFANSTGRDRFTIFKKTVQDSLYQNEKE